MQDLRNTQEETNALLDALLQSIPKLSLENPSSLNKDEGMVSPSQEGHVKELIQDYHCPSPIHTSDKPQDLAPVAIPIKTIPSQDPACYPTCACQCHRRRGVKSPAMLSKISGQLLLGYNGSLVFQQRCNIPTCRQQSAKSPQACYYFPQWFVQRAVTVSMTTTVFGTPNLNIKVRRVVSEMSDLFRLSRFGDVQGCQELFSKQQASPDDVNPIGGWTALHVSTPIQVTFVQG